MDHKSWVIELRREFHKHAEPSWQEQRTAGRVEEILQSLGIATRRVAGTGVVGTLKGSKPGPTIGLRADMDALNQNEKTGAVYASENPGIMHACGHDAHTAALLGAARTLSAEPDLPGTVVFLFQPAEELAGGAKGMLDEGALDGVDAVFGLHVSGTIPVGHVGIRSGPMLAGGDRFRINFHGRGGHGASPHLGIDALAPACSTALALQTIVTKEFEAKDPLVLTVGQVHGGTRFNVVADEAWIDGTVRYYRPEFAGQVEQKVQRIAAATAEAYRTTMDMEYIVMVPPTVNDQAMTDLGTTVIRQTMGDAALLPFEPIMGSEDFSFFAATVPGLFVMIGASNADKGIIYPNHHPQFDIDEDCLEHGRQLYVGFAKAFLAQGGLRQ